METVQDIINFIMWDRRIIAVPPDLSSPFDTVILLNPTISDRNFAAFEKAQAFKAAIAEEVPTEAQIMADALANGYWTEEDETVLKETEKYIARLESERPKKKLLTQKAKIDSEIKSAKEKLEIVSLKKQGLYVLTAEYLSQEMFVIGLILRTLMTLDGTPFFAEHESLLNMRQQNIPLLNFFIKEVVSEGLLPHAELRRVARSTEWRLLWTLNRENLSSLFGIKLSDLSANQRMLTYWSRVYDIAFESTEKPDDDIINDDAKFDEWLNNRNNNNDINKKITSVDNANELGVVLDGYYIDECKCGAAATKALGHGEFKPHEPDCQWGVYKRYTPAEKEERAKQIYSRNSNRVRSLINAEHDAVAVMGTIDEKDLRKGNSRHILGAKQNIENIRK